MHLSRPREEAEGGRAGCLVGSGVLRVWPRETVGKHLKKTPFRGFRDPGSRMPTAGPSGNPDNNGRGFGVIIIFIATL